MAESQNALDRWMMARLEETIDSTTANLQKYDAHSVTSEVGSLLDDLSKWYVRRSRRRYWRTERDADKETAYATLIGFIVLSGAIELPRFF